MRYIYIYMIFTMKNGKLYNIDLSQYYNQQFFYQQILKVVFKTTFPRHDRINDIKRLL